MNDSLLQVVLPGRLSPSEPAAGPLRIEELWKHLEVIVRTSADFFTLIDADYVYRAANDAYCRAHGRKREEILGRTVAEVWGEDVFSSALREPLERCLHGEEIHYRTQFEFPLTGIRLFDVSLYPCSSDDGASTHIIAVTRDVTTPHNAEEQVRLLFQLAQTINQAPDFEAALAQVLRHVCRFTGWTLGQVWCPAPDGQTLVCTPACETNGDGLESFCEASRRKPLRRGEAVPGLVWDSKRPHWAPEFSTDARFPRGRLARELGLNAAMGIPVLADGDVVAVMEFLLASPRSDDERLMGVVSATAEQLGAVFLRKRAEVAYRESEDRYRILIETANDVIFFLTPDGRLASLNRAFETVTGWPRSEWIGKHFAPLLHPDDLPMAAERLQAALEGKPYPRSEYRVRKADGDFAVGEFTIASEIKDGVVTGMFGIGRDISERKRTEQAVIQSEEHYRELFHQAYRMQENLRRLSERILQIQEQERTRISRDLHDEVGQALTAINVNLAVLEKSATAAPPEITQRMADTRHLLEQTMETVHNFSHELRPAMLDDLGLVSALRSYVKSFGKRTGLAVRFEGEEDEDGIEQLDSDRKIVIYRVLQEGLNNTAKHAEAQKVTVEVARKGRRVHLDIRDDGKGFPTYAGRPSEEMPDQLGLLGIAERVRLVSGDFTVESQPGHGTRIHVSIPFKT